MRTLLLLILAGIFTGVNAQTNDSLSNVYLNSADNQMLNTSRLTIGGYGEIHYNQPLNSGIRNNGSLDVHRMVLMFGYKFNDRAQFVSEIEFEHIGEVAVEQAFLQYKINNYINFRGGLLLTPMGIINEYHEPTTFNGVERPFVDKYISPTTWREVGAGFSGTYLPASLKYQVYVVNGFKSFDGSGTLNGKYGLRKGRQKGAESFMSAPNVTGKIEYFGIRGLNVGLSGYFGKTQSTLYDGVDKNDHTAIAHADSSVVGVSMVGVDARYTTGGWQLRGQYYYAGLSNTRAYNRFTAANGTPNDLGSSLMGYYAEAGYNVFRGLEKKYGELIPFARYAYLNTQNTVAPGISRNSNNEKKIITTGLTWKITPGAVIKADMQFMKSEADNAWSKTLNTGIGIMF